MCVECGCDLPAKDERTEDRDNQKTTVDLTGTEDTTVA